MATKKIWTIYAGSEPADAYAGPYTSFSEAQKTLKWMKKNLLSPEGSSFFYIVASKLKLNPSRRRTL
jgi:hypothetical protein